MFVKLLMAVVVLGLVGAASATKGESRETDEREWQRPQAVTMPYLGESGSGAITIPENPIVRDLLPELQPGPTVGICVIGVESPCNGNADWYRPIQMPIMEGQWWRDHAPTSPRQPAESTPAPSDELDGVGENHRSDSFTCKLSEGTCSNNQVEGPGEDITGHDAMMEELQNLRQENEELRTMLKMNLEMTNRLTMELQNMSTHIKTVGRNVDTVSAKVDYANQVEVDYLIKILHAIREHDGEARDPNEIIKYAHYAADEHANHTMQMEMRLTNLLQGMHAALYQHAQEAETRDSTA